MIRPLRVIIPFIQMVIEASRSSNGVRQAMCVCFAAILSACGTLIHVVDDDGCPVEGAKVYVHYPSITTMGELTDSCGYARVADSWLCRPFFVVTPQSIGITNGVFATRVAWPPPCEIVLCRK